jgi:hypothetical protein
MARCGGGRPTVESALAIDIRHLARLLALPGRAFTFNIEWSSGTGGALSAQASFLVVTGQGEATVTCQGVTRFGAWGRDTQGIAAGQTIAIVSHPQSFGGARWFLVCPRRGTSTLRLYLPLGARGFASREAYRLGYACQRESRRDQALRRARKARAKIGGSVNLTLPLPPKPKWMRWRTYDRHRSEVDRALGVVTARTLPILQRLQRRLRKGS